jgi:hypothetical protein
MTTTFPAPVFDHLLRLTDRRGTFGHARLAEPLPEHGYCTDDVARVLVVATRDHRPDRTLNGLAGVALRFLNDAQALTGACRNEMDSMGSWVDETALDDAWGRRWAPPNSSPLTQGTARPGRCSPTTPPRYPLGATTRRGRGPSRD